MNQGHLFTNNTNKQLISEEKLIFRLKIRIVNGFLKNMLTN